ncbi:3-phosphoshikimate 1-carboxyvinyltransferase [Patiriisocius marinus]|uniref:3-phosphoshikimate 1-carboxyvinyltransferase n=1 Tax=Patiriisocius marinus TaxID=1397112 RepID=A0A5J4J445_9FLAO|nr:3-phosphoshikimate 1-carboxyvinyltransferase [Patiriisocius marinus]GER60663.1 3-phosphoshikimate 1-carboxyvinyltransferase [Patiriisocius marinus]
MIGQLLFKQEILKAAITITGSKSESNRLLILRALYPNLKIDNLSNSDDTKVLNNALVSSDSLIDVHHAGTAMRFLTAYLAITTIKSVTLTGSKRMQERPIKILVDALNSIGASITYQTKEGYPPLLINPPVQLESNVTLDAGVSSQYISALILVAPLLDNGLNITLDGTITSRPYIEMTLQLLKQVGVQANFKNQELTIAATTSIKNHTTVVESDWSSASYYYSIVALSQAMTIKLSSYKENSLQGDSALVAIYSKLGVVTTFNNDNSVTLSKHSKSVPQHIELDLSKTPDIAQTIAVTCFGLGISCHLTGLHTLKIKETDRLEALKIELSRFDAPITITENSLSLAKREKDFDNTRSITIKTYQDHRMAMAFAPLAFLANIAIENPMVVTKSYPDFYKDLEKVGLFLELN